MEKLSEVMNIKKEAIDEQKFSIMTKVDLVKQMDIDSINTEIEIKAEPQESEFAGTSSQVSINFDIKIEMDEPMVEIENEKDLLQDPLDVNTQIKVNGNKVHIKSELEDETNNRMEEASEKEYDFEDKESINKLPEKKKRFDKDMRYTCHICNMTFTQKCLLGYHLSFHHSFTCDVCKTSFRFKSALESHMLSHTDEKIHVCDICNKAFRHKSGLYIHSAVHLDAKPYSCNICEKSFRSRSNLSTHQRRHAGEKPYVCDICNKAFVQNSYLTSHKRSHTSDRPYTCKVCNKSYKQNSGLRMHKAVYKH